jgi:hypothetical protein
MGRGRSTIVVTVTMAGLLMAGCASPSDGRFVGSSGGLASSSGSPSSGSPSSGGSAGSSGSSQMSTRESRDPTRLVGLWQLDAPGQAAGSVLRLGDDLIIWSDCGVLTGDWSANASGLFLGHVSGGSAGCVSHESGDPTPAWLARITRFEVGADGVALLDSSDAVVGRLSPGGHPTPRPDIASQLAEPPTLTDALRNRLSVVAAPLPVGLVAATPQQLLGRWVPEGASSSAKPYADFKADASWLGSDGCNGQGGRWSVAPDGTWLAVAGAQTLMACDGMVDVAGSLTKAARAAFDGSTLVLLDSSNTVVGRLVRAS